VRVFRLQLMNTLTSNVATTQGALKLKDAAKYLGGISEMSVRRLIKRGLIKPHLALRHIIIPVAELDRFLASR